MAIDSSIIFKDGDDDAAADGFGEVKRKVVQELPDEVDGDDGGDDEAGEGSSDTNGGELGKVEEMDVWVAKMMLILFDDSRATWLSVYAYGDITHTEKYKYYDQINSQKHKPLVMALAFVVRKYRLSKAPEAIILVSLAVSTFFLWQMAAADKEAYQEKKAEDAKLKQQQQQQQQHVKTETRQPGKIIKLKPAVAQL